MQSRVPVSAPTKSRASERIASAGTVDGSTSFSSTNGDAATLKGVNAVSTARAPTKRAEGGASRLRLPDNITARWFAEYNREKFESRNEDRPSPYDGMTLVEGIVTWWEEEIRPTCAAAPPDVGALEEVTELRAERDRYRRALEEIALNTTGMNWLESVKLARLALGGTDGERGEE